MNALPMKSPKDIYHADGVVKLAQFLDAAMLARIKACFDWTVANPGPQVNHFTRDGDNLNYGDFSNPDALAFYRQHILALPFASMLRELWGSTHVWYYGEEIFWKKGTAPGTTFHQDTSYLPWTGDHWVNCWISLDPLPKANSIEVIRGSHHGTLYDGNQFNPAEPTEPFWGDKGNLPRLPDINAERKAKPDSWDVVSFDLEPGDVVLFHPGALHGGAPVSAPVCERRTLVLRFFGDQAYWSDLLIDKGTLKDVPAFTFEIPAEGMKPGEPFRDPKYLQLC